MYRFAVLLGYLFALSFMAFIGLLMLLSPLRFSRFLIWFTCGDRWSQPMESWQSRANLEIRLAGLVFCLLSIYMMRPAFTWLFELGQDQGPPAGISRWSVNHDWHSLGAGVLLLGCALSAIVWPRNVVQYWTRQMPNRNVPQTTLKIWTRSLRIMGIVVLLLALSLLGRGMGLRWPGWP